MPNKRALVVYDTKYGATEQVANWIAEGINDADVRHVDDVSSVFYDLIVIGSPVYNDSPSRKIIDFLDKNRDTLANRKLALFTVEMPVNMTPDRAKRFVSSGQIKKLFDHVKGNVIGSNVFLGKIELNELTELDKLSLRIAYFLKGYKLKNVNYMNRDEAVNWGRKLYDTLIHPPSVIPPQPPEK